VNFQQAWNELMSFVPKLSPPFAQKCVQRAWHDIRESRMWSFLVSETVIAVPAQISTGTVTVTNGSDVVLGDATADAAWSAVLSSEFITRQFRSGAGPIYNIVSYTSPNITLDRAFAETTVAGAVYSIYKCYYPPPDDFLRWTSVVDPINGYQFGLDKTKAHLDLVDPLRGAIGEPLVIASYKFDESESPNGRLYELYPHPIVQISYPALYQKAGTAFTSNTAALPEGISDELLMSRARYFAYEWAMANGAAHDELRGVNWLALRQSVLEDYRKDLFNAQKQDEEIFQQNWVEPYTHNRWNRIAYDGTWAYNHAPFLGWTQ
jgi:hypothetical protein